jgi:DOPA 4,5-dioxygenase
MKNFHAHIYFELHQRQTAESVVGRLLNLRLHDLNLYKYYEQNVGPHLLPMAEVHFTESSFKQVLSCLELHNEGLSILVHEDSGDDFKDHEDPVRVGPALPLDFEFFHKVKAVPSLSVH